MTFFYKENDEKFYNKGTDDYCIVEEVLLNEKEINKYIDEQKYYVPKLEDKGIEMGI